MLPSFSLNNNFPKLPFKTNSMLISLSSAKPTTSAFSTSDNWQLLQEISDSVADVEWEEETVGNLIAACAAQTAELAAKINTDRARHRYLENLVDKDNAADDDDEG